MQEMQFLVLFGGNMHYNWPNIKHCQKIYAIFAPFTGPISDEFSEQHQHHKKHHIEFPICILLVQIWCKFDAHFGWEIAVCEL